jgi:hypothetical protein
MSVCPNCHSTNLRRSRTRGLWGRFLRLWGWRTFRCREENCRWRGMIKVETPILKKQLANAKRYVFPVTAALFLFVMLLAYLLRNL